MENLMEITTVKIENPDGLNFILGQSHFIKTVEDIYEIMMTTVPMAKFAVAFCEASDKCLIRHAATDKVLLELAQQNALNLSAGHCFIVFMKDLFPINVLNQIKNCPEVCRVFCATANPVEVIVASTAQGNGVLGVIDGYPPKGVEQLEDRAERKEFLRKIGYKL